MAKFNGKYGAYDSNGDYYHLFENIDPEPLSDEKITVWASDATNLAYRQDRLEIILKHGDEDSTTKAIQALRDDYENEVENVKAIIVAWLEEHNKPKEPSTNEEYKAAIMALVEAHEDYVFAETHCGYHQKNELWGGKWQNRCYLQIAHPYDDPKRLYAKSYAELYKTVKTYYEVINE